MYGGVPPTTSISIEASASQKQLGDVIEATEIAMLSGSFIVKVTTESHAFASLTVSVYIPATNPVSVEAEPPELQA